MCFELECREKKVSALQSFCSREIEREREREREEKRERESCLGCKY
jgi:hypothetical protein